MAFAAEEEADHMAASVALEHLAGAGPARGEEDVAQLGLLFRGRARADRGDQGVSLTWKVKRTPGAAS